MHTHDVQVLLDLDVLIGLGHAAWKGTMHEGGDAALTPQTRVGATQTHNGGWLWPAESPSVGTQDAHHLVVGIADARGAVVQLFHRRLGIACQDLVDLGHYLVLAQPRWQPQIGLKPARPRHHVYFQTALNHADIDGDARHDVPGT